MISSTGFGNYFRHVLPGCTFLLMVLLLGRCDARALEEGCWPEPAAKSASSGTKADLASEHWTLEARMETCDREFAHESFRIHSPVKVSVSYYPVFNQKSKIPFEELWYHDAKPIGMERYSELHIPPSQRVHLKIIQNQVTTCADSGTAANVILRLILSTLLNHDQISSITVPDLSYAPILTALQNHHFVLLAPGQEPPSGTKISCELRSENSGLKQRVHFQQIEH